MSGFSGSFIQITINNGAGDPYPAPVIQLASFGASTALVRWPSLDRPAGDLVRYIIDIAYDSAFTNFQTQDQWIDKAGYVVGSNVEYPIMGLDPQTHYWVRVRAEYTAQLSANSNVVDFTTEEAAAFQVFRVDNTGKAFGLPVFSYLESQRSEGPPFQLQINPIDAGFEFEDGTTGFLNSGWTDGLTYEVIWDDMQPSSTVTIAELLSDFEYVGQDRGISGALGLRFERITPTGNPKAINMIRISLWLDFEGYSQFAPEAAVFGNLQSYDDCFRFDGLTAALSASDYGFVVGYLTSPSQISYEYDGGTPVERFNIICSFQNASMDQTTDFYTPADPQQNGGSVQVPSRF